MYENNTRWPVWKQQPLDNYTFIFMTLLTRVVKTWNASGQYDERIC